MGIVQKEVNCRNIRVLFGRGEVSFRAAQAMIEGLQGTLSLNPKALDYVPASTRRWLDRLSDGEKARLAIITNATADVIYCQSNRWKNYEKAGSIITRTMVAYPAANEKMPARLEYASRVGNKQGVLRVLETKDLAGLRGIAIAFDRCEVEWVLSNGDIIEKIRPRGQIIVIDDFPQMTNSFETDEYPVLGGRGDRYIHRVEGPWIGHIVRTCLGGFCTPPNESIFVCDPPAKLFGTLIELQPEEPKRQVPQHERLLLPEWKEEAVEGPIEKRTEPPKELDHELKAELRERILKRVLYYSFNPDRLLEDTPAILEVGGRLADIARENKHLQDNLREYVRGQVGWSYMQLGNHETVMEFAQVFHKLCIALGVPKEKK